MASKADNTERKDARVAVRLTPTQDAKIRDAAAETGQSLTDFITSAAMARAEDTLADRRVFYLNDEKWEELMAILDRPPRAIPGLGDLLRDAANWDIKRDEPR